MVHCGDESIVQSLMVKLSVGSFVRADAGVVLLVFNRVRPASFRLQRFPIRDGENPRRRLARTSELACSLPHDHHCVVEHFLDELLTLNEREQEASEAWLVDPVQHFERLQVVSRDAGKQLLFLGGAAAGIAGAGTLYCPGPDHLRSLSHSHGCRWGLERFIVGSRYSTLVRVAR